MNALDLPGCNVMLPFTRLMNAQSSPDVRMRGAGFLGLVGGLLIFATWFSMRYSP